MNKHISLVHRIVCVEASALQFKLFTCPHNIHTHARAYFVTLGMQTFENLNSFT